MSSCSLNEEIFKLLVKFKNKEKQYLKIIDKTQVPFSNIYRNKASSNHKAAQICNTFLMNGNQEILLDLEKIGYLEEIVLLKKHFTSDKVQGQIVLTERYFLNKNLKNC